MYASNRLLTFLCTCNRFHNTGVVVYVEIVPKQQRIESETNVYTPSNFFFFWSTSWTYFVRSLISHQEKDSQCFVHLSIVILSKRTEKRWTVPCACRKECARRGCSTRNLMLMEVLKTQAVQCGGWVVQDRKECAIKLSWTWQYHLFITLFPLWRWLED
jgi:hypothetical protein